MKEKDISDLVGRYKQMLVSGKSIYFDAEEFDELAEYYDLMDENDTAKIIVETGLKIHPTSDALRLKKAKYMLYEMKYEQAYEYIQNNFSEYDFELYLLKIECLLHLDMYDEAGKLAAEILQDDENELDITYSELGFLYTEADCFDDGTYFFERSLEFNPNNAEALTELSYAYEMKGDYSSAVKTSNKILDIDPYSFETWVNIGKLYTMLEEYENAIDAFDFALTINDSDTNLLKLKAHCLFLSDRVEEALEIFETCINLSPNDAPLLYSLAECYLALEDYDQMLDYLDKYQAIKGESSDVIAKKAFAYMQKGDIEKSWSFIKQGLDLDPDSEDLNVVAGEIKFLSNDFNEAEGYFLKAHETNTGNETILDRLSVISISKDQFERAIGYLEDLLLIDPKSPAKIRLALLYFETGDQDRFDEYLDSFANEDLKSLLEVFFPESRFDLSMITREALIARLDDARECRQLFKNIQY